MNTFCRRTIAILILLFALPSIIQAQGAKPSPISVPAGIKNLTVKYGENETLAQLKPAEQVAFLFLSAIWGLEESCLDKDMGIGRLCTLPELAKGVKTNGGEILGLEVDPSLDSNYTYDAILIGKDCVLRAIPRGPGLGAFARVGSPRRSSGNFYYNPKGSTLVSAEKLTEYGYEGHGFSR
jgi:hypothetical protein